jgi:hypothetical protein
MRSWAVSWDQTTKQRILFLPIFYRNIFEFEQLKKKSNFVLVQNSVVCLLFNLLTFYFIKTFNFNADIQVFNRPLSRFINLLLKTVQLSLTIKNERS